MGSAVLPGALLHKKLARTDHRAGALQVLLSQVHRLRALVLLGRFLDVGIFPYVLKLLQTTASDLRTTLILIWTKILALDKSCQVGLP